MRNQLLSFIHKVRNFQARIFTLILRSSFQSIGDKSYIFLPFIHLRGLNRISIGSQTCIFDHAQLTTWQDGTISIGNKCILRNYVHITAVNHISIGDNLLTGTNVLITDNSHGDFTQEQLNIHPSQRPIVSKGPVNIGNNVWLGNNVCIMPGVTIGDGVTIAANSVVTHDIPSYCMAAGVPAKIIKQI